MLLCNYVPNINSMDDVGSPFTFLSFLDVLVVFWIDYHELRLFSLKYICMECVFILLSKWKLKRNS